MHPIRTLLTLALASLSLSALAGCDGVDSFATAPDEVFRGGVVGVVEPSVVRRGFEPETVLEMSFDPSRVARLGDPPPGVLTTSDGSLSAVPLEPIVPLSHDVLSTYEIPAGDRIRNYIFVIRPTEGPLAGREPFVFVSLMGDGGIEVRIVAGGGQREGDYFGLFRLEREPL